jgi:hypothetical protein
MVTLKRAETFSAASLKSFVVGPAEVVLIEQG